MTVYVAWVSDEPEPELPGPWVELRVAAPGLLLIESDDTLSRVFQAAPSRGRHVELAARANPSALTRFCAAKVIR